MRPQRVGWNRAKAPTDLSSCGWADPLPALPVAGRFPSSNARKKPDSSARSPAAPPAAARAGDPGLAAEKRNPDLPRMASMCGMSTAQASRAKRDVCIKAISSCRASGDADGCAILAISTGSRILVHGCRWTHNDHNPCARSELNQAAFASVRENLIRSN